jgi:hypothetical protein
MAIDLTPAEDELMKKMKKDTRYGVRRAGREGVKVVEDNSPEAKEDFWGIFEQTAARKDFWYRPKEYQFAAWQSMYDTCYDLHLWGEVLVRPGRRDRLQAKPSANLPVAVGDHALGKAERLHPLRHDGDTRPG